MTTRFDVLPDAQRRLVAQLAPLRRHGFVLYGGTAIALHLGHRVSIDFDFFTDRSIARDALMKDLSLLANVEIVQDEHETLSVLAQGQGMGQSVKVSFFSRLGFGRVGTPSDSDGGALALASRADLMGHKLKVLLQRVEAKDYLDIAALLANGQTLESGIGAALALFPSTFPPSEALRALTYFGDGDLRSLDQRHRDRLIAAVDRFTSPAVVPILSTHLSA